MHGGFLKWWVSPTNPLVFPTKNDQPLGCEMGVPPFKETPHICLYYISTGIQSHPYRGDGSFSHESFTSPQPSRKSDEPVSPRAGVAAVEAWHWQ